MYLYRNRVYAFVWQCMSWKGFILVSLKSKSVETGILMGWVGGGTITYPVTRKWICAIGKRCNFSSLQCTTRASVVRRIIPIKFVALRCQSFLICLLNCGLTSRMARGLLFFIDTSPQPTTRALYLHHLSTLTTCDIHWNNFIFACVTPWHSMEKAGPNEKGELRQVIIVVVLH